MDLYSAALQTLRGITGGIMQNIFIVGLDDFNRRELESIRQAGECSFIDLLGYDAVVRPREGRIDFDALLRQARVELDDFSGTIDAIATFWDFPSSSLAPVLRNERGLPGPSNEAVARCEHKYWSRLEQQSVVPALVPEFCAVDPFDDASVTAITLDYPFWIKPIKAHSSYLGFKIHNADELRRHIQRIRDGIALFGVPFDQYLRHLTVPAVLAGIGGHWCIAEAMISTGQQCTLEGYVHRGEVAVYGVVDSIRSGKHRSSFARYQYPSRLPRRTQSSMIEAAARVMTHIGYDNAPFNMEFYWNHRTGDIRLLEINARISKSHCPLFRLVDGASHQEVMVDLALGQRPEFPHRQGDFRVAGKFMVRVHEDGIVRGMPTAVEIARVQERFPEARIHPLATEGTALKHLPYQDSYSFELAEIFLGADSQKQLLEKYNTCLELLTFDVEPRPDAA
ncbi:ATP-grasp domain-containing protein [Haliea sp. E1-2-M8]|uniref:ATP-grasp domain-containing protein n=1 Tax=Haliea sp. E1-2-M8 TaxID=3064706 RepID=UPI0027264492|nr:ATP-grasp domain-containing protein [Haliea sp. E1-2-M8]MDO8863678.1 ATP-grasp domain-containing protein [Haliea sp. E1-2-M8]